MAITRTAIVDDDGTLTTGTIINNAWKSELYDQIDASTGAVIQTTTSTGTQNNFALTTGAGVLRCNNATLLTLTGLSAGYDGQRLVILSVGAGQVDLSHQAAGSTATNRLINFATSGATSLAAGSGTAILSYDTTTGRWRLITHEQGAWITGSAVTLTGNGSMTISGTSFNTAPRWRLSGRTLTWTFDVAFTTGGVANTQVLVPLPNGFTGGGQGFMLYNKTLGTTALSQIQATTNLVLFADLSATANWTLAAHRTMVMITQDVT